MQTENDRKPDLIA